MEQLTAAAQKSFLDRAGAVVTSVVKHVPTRGILWGAIGLFVGLVCVVLSYVIGLFALGRGALILGYLAAIPIALPFLGGALFFMHGLHRGAARAALELEKKFGLVDYVVSGVLCALIDNLGVPVSNMPLQQLETKLKAVLEQTLRVREGSGLAAWVVQRAKRSLTKKAETYLMNAYRAELQADGSGGGVSLERVGARVKQELAGGLGSLLMSPLDKQLWIFMTAYVLIAGGWWFWIFLLLRMITRS
jgi:hypothetical protein